MPEKHNFDFDAFYRALEATVAGRKTSWRAVSDETGVSQSTLSRMSGGSRPDAASLTALSAWAGLNPVTFMEGQLRAPEPMALVGQLLRSDPKLDHDGASALEAIIQAAYEQFRKKT